MSVPFDAVARVAGARDPTPWRGASVVLDGASKRHGAMEALRPLTLEIREGERVAVVGPSGAGKSTLLGLVNTSLAPASGRVCVLGQDPATLAAPALRRLRARIGTVYQHLLLVPQLTVMQNVVAGRLGRTSLPRALVSLVSRREAERLAGVLEEMGMADRIHERLDRLSGGEQQRVAIARTLYQDPDLVVADEPLASVDPARASEILELFRRAFAGRTLIVTTHRLEPLLPHVDRVIGLRAGALAFDKPSAAVTLDDLAELYEARRGARSPSTNGVHAPAPEPPAGTLRLGASNTPGEFMLPAVVRRFVAAYPGVPVSLAIKDSADVAADLLASRVEIAFVGARSAHPGVVHEDFVEDEIVVVAARSMELPREPIPVTDLSRLPRVEREQGSGTRAVVEEHLENMGAPLDPGAVALEVGTLVGLKAAVLSGIGVAFMSRSAVVEDLEAGHLRVVRVEGLKIPRHIFVARRRGEEPSAAARRFVEVARETCAARMGRG